MNWSSKIPFLWIAGAVCAGIVVARYIAIPLWIIVLCAVVCYLFAWVGLRHRYGGVYLVAAVVLSAMALTVTSIQRQRAQLPEGERILVGLQATDIPMQSKRWWRTTAVVDRWRYADGELAERGWQRVREQVLLYVDTCYKVDLYRSMIVRGYANPIDTTSSSYGQLMHARGFHNRIYVIPGGVIAVADTLRSGSAPPLRYYARQMQSAAAQSLQLLGLTAGQQAVVSAMTIGRKQGMDRSLREDYSRIGAAHLLAVSGLHVGIVFMLINILLVWLPVFRYGNTVRCIAAVSAIWLYAAVTGLSPSVLRAALMFSAAQIAVGVGVRRNGLNIMLGSGVVMLLVEPLYLFDMSFQLSYAAVLSIVCFFARLYSFVRCRYSVVNVLSSVMVVGLAATIGTAPLVAYYFGNFPVMGLLLNPIVIFTAHVVVLVSMVWIIAPFAAWKPVAAWIVGSAAWLQNGVIGWGAERWWASATVSLPLWGVLLCYLLLVVAAVMIGRYKPKKELSLPL